MEIQMVIFIIVACFLVLCALLILYFVRREQSLLRRIQTMVDQAVDGCFQESIPDESRISAVETSMYRYLYDSQMSWENIRAEKEHIQTMISNISHQTVTPVTNILLYTKLLEEWLDSQVENCQDAKEYLACVEHQASQLNFLVEALVKLSRLETGLITARVQERPVQPLLSQIERQFLPEAVKKGIQLTVGSTEEQAVFDLKWTMEAVANVVDNAVKYTPCGGKVSVCVKPYSFFNCIAVTDNGIGIGEKEQGRIFTRFYRCAGTEEEPGLGIGLYLAREIIKAQGGYIKLASRPGEGSTFSVFLQKKEMSQE